MYHLVILILSIVVLILLLFFRNYKLYSISKKEDFGLGKLFKKVKKSFCKKDCPSTCKFNTNLNQNNNCNIKNDVCRDTREKCKRNWDNDFLKAVNGIVNEYLNEYYSMKYGINDSQNFDNKENNRIDLDNVKEALNDQIKSIDDLRRAKSFNDTDKSVEVNECRTMLSRLRKVNKRLITAHDILTTLNSKDQSEISTSDYSKIKSAISGIQSSTKLLEDQNTKCNYLVSKDTGKTDMIDAFDKKGQATLDLIYASLSDTDRGSLEGFRNQNEKFQQIKKYQNIIRNYFNNIIPVTEKFNEILKNEIKYSENTRVKSNKGNTFKNNKIIEPLKNSKKGETIEGFQTQSLKQVKNTLNTYKIQYNNQFLGSKNTENSENVYGYLEDKVNQYSGDQYLKNEDDKISDSRIEESKIPYNVRKNALRNKFPYSVKSCYTKWNDIDNNDDEKTFLNDIFNVEKIQSRSLIQKDYKEGEKAVNETKKAGFWSENKWITKENVNNSSNCNGIMGSGEDRKISNQLVAESNLKDYIGNAQQIELERKQILTARSNIYRDMTGIDQKNSVIQEPSALCPIIDNPEDEINDWRRSIEQDYCSIDDSFKNDGSTHEVSGTMLPGQIGDNGVDQWIENIQNLQNSRNIYKSILGKNNTTDYKVIQDGTKIDNELHSRNIDLLRLSGNSIQRTLQDRDWSLSSDRWSRNMTARENKNQTYIIEEYFKMFQNIKIDNSTIYTFKITYTDVDNNRQFSVNEDISHILDTPMTTSNISITPLSDNNFSGVIRLFENAYQFSDYSVDQVSPINSLTTISGLTKDMVGLQYNILTWELDELVEKGLDLHIVCPQVSLTEDLYNENNGFLSYHNGSQFGKCYYSQRNIYKSLMFDMNILNSSEPGKYYIFNKNSQKYLAYGVNYNSNINFLMSSEEIDLYNPNVLNTRTPCFYWISQDNINKGNLPQMKIEMSWSITRKGNNKYLITHSSGQVLWYSSSSFQPRSIPTNQIEGIPLEQDLGHIECSNSDNNSFCDISETNCYNKYFHIIPREPMDITSDFEEETLDNGNKDLRKNCSSNNGIELESDKKWFRTINDTFSTPYSNLDENSGELISSSNSNNYSNIYSMYGGNDNVITSLGGGGGWNCSKSNYCHVEKYVSNKYKNETEYSSNSTQLSFSNKNNKNETITFQQPINKHKYKCVKNSISTYKISDNNDSIDFTTTLDPNLDLNSNNNNKKVAVLVYSNNHKEGEDFGLGLNGNYIWFKDTTELSDIIFYKKNEETLLEKYIVIQNMNNNIYYKSKRKIILQWYERLRYQKIGLSTDSRRVYSYPNIFSDSNIQLELIYPPRKQN